MEFKERLKILRKEKKLTQGELAEVLHYGYTAVSNYESGRNEPSIKDLISLADYFHVSLDYLVGYIDLRCRTEQELYQEVYQTTILPIAQEIEEMYQKIMEKKTTFDKMLQKEKQQQKKKMEKE